MLKDDVEPNALLVQRDAIRSATDDHDQHPSGSNLEAVMARISAEVTAAAARQRACKVCGKPLLEGCVQGVRNGSLCTNKSSEKSLDLPSPSA